MKWRGFTIFASYYRIGRYDKLGKAKKCFHLFWSDSEEMNNFAKSMMLI